MYYWLLTFEVDTGVCYDIHHAIIRSDSEDEAKALLLVNTKCNNEDYIVKDTIKADIIKSETIIYNDYCI